MNKESVLMIAVVTVIGFFVGLAVFSSEEPPAGAKPAVASVPAVDHQAKIDELKVVVDADPGNRSAWVQLGNNYYDTDQFVQAIEAYSKALEIDGNDPNVLTDQGIMFRQVGWSKRAVSNFLKANEVDPTHPQSLYNLGLVYRDDLSDKEKAKHAWTMLLEIIPQGKDADRIRTMIEHMEKGHG
jgi:cytochrome c-type biogenesis protein CcmH/NrfG